MAEARLAAERLDLAIVLLLLCSCGGRIEFPFPSGKDVDDIRLLLRD